MSSVTMPCTKEQFYSEIKDKATNLGVPLSYLFDEDKCDWSKVNYIEYFWSEMYPKASETSSREVEGIVNLSKFNSELFFAIIGIKEDNRNIFYVGDYVCKKINFTSWEINPIQVFKVIKEYEDGIRYELESKSGKTETISHWCLRRASIEQIEDFILYPEWELKEGCQIDYKINHRSDWQSNGKYIGKSQGKYVVRDSTNNIGEVDSIRMPIPALKITEEEIRKQFNALKFDIVEEWAK